MTELARQHCKPQEGKSPMGDADVHAHLAPMKGWTLVDGAIQKRFAFKDYHQTIGFVNASAWIANAENHHPDLAVAYDHCVVRLNTHSVKGISVNDFICAAKLDALIA
ncbi:MAG: 4a-hydroxytetrahydrobiopterin dehydratase [Pseudomonadota bacterium]|nr:4a-hydroxytetrahydrobiopterin dehydratase [Pseudomonadota bacterium]